MIAAVVSTPACSDDDGSDSEGTGAPIDTVPAVVEDPGVIVGQQSVDGRLADAVVVVDPTSGTTSLVEVPDLTLAGGVPAGPGRAFYSTDQDIVLVDTTVGTVTDLGLPAAQYSPAVAAATGGVGDDWAALVDAPGSAPVIVDLLNGDVTDLSPVTGDTEVFAAVLDADESTVLVSREDATFLVPIDDPAAGEQVGDGFGQFIGDGSSILVTGADGTVVRTVEAGDEVTLSDEPESGGLALGNRVVLARDQEVQLVDPATGEVVATAPFTERADGPVVVGDAVLLGGDGQTWTVLDGATAAVTPLDDLTGFTAASTPPLERWAPFESAPGPNASVVGVDTDDGSVVTIEPLPTDEQITSWAAFSPTGPWALVATDAPEQDGEPVTRGRLVNLATGELVDLGDGFQGGSFSPDGEQVAWSSGPDAELRVAPVDDVSAAEVVASVVAVPIWLAA